MSDGRGENYKYFGEDVIMFLGGERVLVKLSHYNFSNDSLDGVAFFTGQVKLKGVQASGRWTQGNPDPLLAPVVPVIGARPFSSREAYGREFAFFFLPKDASEDEIAELAAYITKQEHGQPSTQRDVTMGDGGQKPDVGGGRVDDTPTAEIPDATEYHPADTNKNHKIEKDEAKAWNKANPDEPVERG